MRRYKTLEEAQIELIELLEEEREFRGTLRELSERLNVKPESVRPLLQLLKSSGDIIYEVNEDGFIVRPATMIPAVPPVLTPQQEKEVEEKVKQGYRLIACSTMGGVQSRELRQALGKKVIVYFRNGSKVEA